jgi:phosphoglycerate kinase
VISKAKMILWNGPMGMFEDPKFKRGTYEIARAIFRNIKSFSVVGGGETVACFRKANPQYNIENRRLFLSTGGGAMLEYLAGKKLPGIEALKNKIRNSNIEIRNKCKCAI